MTADDFVIVDPGVKNYYNPIEEDKTWNKTAEIHKDFVQSVHHICASFRRDATQRVREQSADLIMKFNIPSRIVDDEIARGRDILVEQSAF